MVQNESVEFTKQSFSQFKRVYRRTIKAKRQSFMFENKKFLTDYAKYVVQYLEPKFNKA